MLSKALNDKEMRQRKGRVLRLPSQVLSLFFSIMQNSRLLLVGFASQVTDVPLWLALITKALPGASVELVVPQPFALQSLPAFSFVRESGFSTSNLKVSTPLKGIEHCVLDYLPRSELLASGHINTVCYMAADAISHGGTSGAFLPLQNPSQKIAALPDALPYTGGFFFGGA